MAHKESVTTAEYAFTAVFEPAEEGGYVVTVPSLRGVVTEGDTLDEARWMVADAIQCYLESLQKDGLPIPPSEEHEREPLKAELVKVHIPGA